ncbi:MAG: glycerophosphodiester phosphodiesterase [Dehalococcoidia bacterium]
MPIQIIAHRTCPLDTPENSVAGVHKAAELGADGVEIDIWNTLDGVPILMHDWTPWRTTRLPGPVRLYPSFLIKHARLEESEERVPRLGEALDVLVSNGLFMAIEAKDPGAAPQTLRLVRERKLESRVLLWSYHERPLRYISERAPEVEPALLRDVFDPEGINRYLEDAVRFGARAISPHWGTITPQLVGEAHDRGLRVYAMNRDMDSVAKKAACGLDGIVTDNPREVRAIVEAAGP